MKRFFVFALLCSVLSVGITDSADAQFFKKLFGKKKEKKHKITQTVKSKDGKKKAEKEEDAKLTKREKKKKEKEERKRRKQREKDRKEREKELKNKKKKQAEVPKRPPRTPLLAVKPRVEPVFPEPKLKQTYRIHILSPIYLDDLVKGQGVTFKDKVPEKAQEGLAFYQGVMIAVDTLKRAGFNLDVYMHDVGSFSESSEMLVTFHKLDSADLILGAVPARDISVLAGHAKKRKINFISALSPADGAVKDNQYFTLLQPSLQAHCEYIVNDIARRKVDRNVVLLYRNSVQSDDNACKYVTSEAADRVTFDKLLCNVIPKKSELLTVLDTTRPNLVIMPIVDQVFADSLLRKLSKSFPNTHFEVYGMPPWNDIPSLRKAMGYPNVMVKVTYPFSFDSTSEIRSYIDKAFRKDYGSKPSDLVYRGYEAMYWYANMLHEYGTQFNPRYKDNSAAPFTRFEVKPTWDKTGGFLYYENQQLFMSTYEGGISQTESR